VGLRLRGSRLFVCLGVCVALGLVSAAGAAVDTPTVTLVSPKNGAVVARSSTKSPLFKWQTSDSLAEMFVELQISTNKTFPSPGTATQPWYCGTTGTDCPSSKQWKNSDWWYTNSDGCTMIPPIGGPCKNGVNATGRCYWRVKVGDAVSPVWTMQVTSAGDRTAPHVSTQPGSGRRGGVGYFTFFVQDDGSSTRLLVELVHAHRTVLRGRLGWGSHGLGIQQRVSMALPKSLARGGYSWCVTAYDRAGNHAKSCSRYAIT